MTTENYDMLILGAVYKQDDKSLKQLYSKDGDTFVTSAYRLYRNGLITPKKNFIEGGDSDVPIDIVSPENFKTTAHGSAYWKMRDN